MSFKIDAEKLSEDEQYALCKFLYCLFSGCAKRQRKAKLKQFMNDLKLGKIKIKPYVDPYAKGGNY